MKLELITINDLNNYGNRLQNYATQKFLQKKDFRWKISWMKAIILWPETAKADYGG